MMNAWRRKLIRGLVVAVALMVILVVSLPAWLPLALRPLLRGQDISFGKYQHLGYSRLALRDLQGPSISVERVELYVPTLWLWHKWRGNSDQPYLVLDHWHLSSRQSAGTPQPTVAVLDRTAENLTRLVQWLPVAQLNDGTIASGSNELSVATVQWRAGELTAKLNATQFNQEVVLSANLRQPFKLNLEARPLGLNAELNAHRQDNQWELSGLAVWPQSRVEFAWGPERAWAKSEYFEISPTLLALKGYQALTGQFTASWSNNSLRVDLAAAATPEGTNVPVQIQLRLDETLHLDAQLHDGSRVQGQAQMTWNAEGAKFSELATDWTRKDSRLQLTGAAELTFKPELSTTIAVNSGTLSRHDQALYKLTAPAQLTFQRGSVTVDSLRWASQTGEVFVAGTVAWPERGSINIQGRRVDLGDFQDFTRLVTPAFLVNTFDLTAGWTNGPVRFRLAATAEAHASNELIQVAAQVTGDENGIHLKPLTGSGHFGNVLTVEGTVPVTLDPTHPTNVVVWLNGKQFDLRARSLPNTQFWEEIGQLTGLQLKAPNLEADVHGPATAPTGHVTFVAEAISVASNRNWRIPEVQQLRVNIDVNAKQARATAEAQVEGQPVRVFGTVPLDKQLDWHKAEATVEIHNAKVAPFARLLPKVLAPQGTFDADVTMRAGWQFFGSIRLHDAATRPLPPLGSLRDINVAVTLTGREFTVTNTGASVGDQPVTISGKGVLSENGVQQFTVSIVGTNVPLVRQPNIVLRSTVALELSQTNGPAHLHGEAVMRDGLFLQELTSLVSRQLEQPLSRPPYFSIETQPLAAWTLDVHVTGEKFLRVRTPLFRGEVSVDLRLGGTLQEPVALGTLRINSGTVLFPFGNVEIDRGTISLTSENPYRPQLAITGSGQVYSYNIKMDVSGNASAPIIVFSSTPPLGSEQILLMLTAGEVPRSDFSLSMSERANRLALFFGKNLLTQLGFGDNTAERLVIRSGEDITERGGTTYNIEYKLTERWSATAEYDRYNQLNAGLKWKILSK